MTKRPNKAEQARLLTEAELKLMKILWSLGEATVNDLLLNLPDGQHLAYTSVSTIMRILEQKQVVRSRKEGRGHVYIPNIMKDQYEERALSHVIDKVFEKEPVSLVKRLVDSNSLSESDLDVLRRIFLGDQSK